MADETKDMAETRVPTINLQVTAYVATRQAEKVGDDLVTGESRYDLVVTFPTGKKHLIKVTTEVFDDYIEALEAAGAFPLPPLGGPIASDPPTS